MPLSNTIALLLLLVAVPAARSIQLNCPLEWTDHRFGDPLPNTTVAATLLKYYVARIYDKQSDRYKVGSMELISGLAYINDQIYTSYQLLTNPNKCDLSWIRQNTNLGYTIPNHAWPVGLCDPPNLQSNYVGRVLIGEDFIAGNAVPVKGQIHIGERTAMRLFGKTRNYTTNAKRFQILTSFSGGLTETLTEFEFQDIVPPGSIDYIGGDLLRNDGDVELVHTVMHRKTVRNTFIYTHLGTLSIELLEMVRARGNVPRIISADIDINATERLTTHYKFSRESYTEQEIVIQREVILPPRTAVQVCSAIEFSKSIENSFKATSTITGRGMSGKELYNFLKKNEPGFEGEIHGNSVVREVKAAVSASSAVATKFIVLPLDAMEDCEALRKQAANDGKERENELRKIKDRYDFDMSESNYKLGLRVATYEPELRNDTKFQGEKASRELLMSMKQKLKFAQ